MSYSKWVFMFDFAWQTFCSSLQFHSADNHNVRSQCIVLMVSMLYKLKSNDYRMTMSKAKSFNTLTTWMNERLFDSLFLRKRFSNEITWMASSSSFYQLDSHTYTQKVPKLIQWETIHKKKDVLNGSQWSSFNKFNWNCPLILVIYLWSLFIERRILSNG